MEVGHERSKASQQTFEFQDAAANQVKQEAKNKNIDCSLSKMCSIRAASAADATTSRHLSCCVLTARRVENSEK